MADGVQDSMDQEDQKGSKADVNMSLLKCRKNSGNKSVDTGSSDTESEVSARGNWGRQIDFLFSCVGYAIGLGNFWRFPYLCMRNGGGAFLIPYFIFLVLCGMPLYFMELSLGQFSSRSPISMWVISPLFKGLGFSMILVSGIMCIYYNVILAWAMYYMFVACTAFKSGVLPWASCDNPWNTDACLRRTSPQNLTSTVNMSWLESVTAIPTYNVVTEFQNATANQTVKTRTPTTEFWEREVLGMTSRIEDVGTVRWELALCLLLVWVLVFACLCKGIKSSGKVVYVTATAPYLMLLVLLVRGLTLPGATKGIIYYLKPDFKRLLEFKVWVEACAQIFYSLGPAYGSLITMASYNKFHNNCYRDSIIIPMINCLTSFFCGFVVFSIVGFLAHSANLDVDKVITSGAGLAFIVYPEALSLLPLSPLWGVIFFAMLVIIGLDTQFGMFETMTSCFVDEFPRQLQGKKTLFTALMCLTEFMLGIPLVTQGGIYFFTILDWYSATFSLITISAVECIVIAWRYGADRLYGDIKLMIGYQPCAWFKICWMGITPLVLLIVLGFTVVTFSAPYLDDYTFPAWAITLGWVVAIFSLVPIPLVMLIKVLQSRGSLLERLSTLSGPTQEWCPWSLEDRKGTRYETNILSLKAQAPESFA